MLPITPVAAPVTGWVRVPGSKSITNRALVLASLADGSTILRNALFADDTHRMMDCLRGLGATIEADEAAETITVVGRGTIPASRATLFVGNSGTTARFITPVAALGHGIFTVDGVARMRERPMGDLVRALRQLGVEAESLGANGCPPLRINARGLRGGACRVRSDTSSQFLSGLLLASPRADGEKTIISLDGPILSAPYIAITTTMMHQFGAVVEVSDDEREYLVPGRQQYQPLGAYAVEPDASAASYFFAAAAITGGHVRVTGIGKTAMQGDAAFADVLEAMGCVVTRAADFLEVRGTGELRGIAVDMNAISDTVMTLAALAPFATSPTVIENVAHIRHKETDRLTAVAAELSRLGVRVDERADGLTIYPAPRITPATVQTYDDHRMAMAFALVGLRAPGVVIADPKCVAKTFPDYFGRLSALTAGSQAAPGE
ncbi:MAG: 3-phosphoshikimate 1-carboxyvinyltransferase [Cytophagales bacterium]|nr:3-phosphoshikimate 1-carboxyvinyltransferase [Armatimonadota bacterium]